MLKRAVTLVTFVAIACVSAAGCPLGSSGSLPAPVTLAGVGGIKVGMNSMQVAHLLHAPILVRLEGSSAEDYVPIGVGRMQGVATFFGPDGNFVRPGGDTLESVWFRAGALTQADVGVGSTRRAVTRAYASALRRDGAHSLYLMGKPVVTTPGEPGISPVIKFMFEVDRVSALGYGTHDQLVGRSPTVNLFCH